MIELIENVIVTIQGGFLPLNRSSLRAKNVYGG